MNKLIVVYALVMENFWTGTPPPVRNSPDRMSITVERLKEFKGMDMVLFVVMVIGVIGTLLIERQLHISNRSEIKIPVRSDDTPYFSKRR